MAPGWPACIAHRLTTAVSIGDTLRATTDCAAVMMCPATSTGSTAWCGCAPWPPLPSMLIVMRSAAAIIGPGPDRDLADRQSRPVVQRVDLVGREALEQAVLDHRAAAGVALLARLEDQRDACRRTRASRPGSAPPRAASSCGRRARSRACGRRSATCARRCCPPASAARPCPRAGPTERPLAVDRPRTTATIPVLPTPVWCSMPSAVSRSATMRAVRCSSNPSSGCAWRSRRSATNSSCQRPMCSTERFMGGFSGPRRARCAAAGRPRSTGGRRSRLMTTNTTAMKHR